MFREEEEFLKEESSRIRDITPDFVLKRRREKRRKELLNGKISRPVTVIQVSHKGYLE